MNQLQIAAGSIVGRGHVGRGNLLLGRNNQDAHSTFQDDEILIAVVSDGCGSGDHSEVGAQLGAELTVAAIRKEWQRLQAADVQHQVGDDFWERIATQVTAVMHSLAEEISVEPSEYSTTIGKYFLATTIGILHTRAGTWVFAGEGSDGVYSVNGKTTVLHPQEGNEPVYLAYRLVQTKYSNTPELMKLRTKEFIPPGVLRSAMIGTDGVIELIDRAGSKIPGQNDTLKGLSWFWENDKFFTDHSALERFLRLVNSEVSTVGYDEKGRKVLSREHGLLRDDATMVVVRSSTSSVPKEQP